VYDGLITRILNSTADCSQDADKAPRNVSVMAAPRHNYSNGEFHDFISLYTHTHCVHLLHIVVCSWDITMRTEFLLVFHEIYVYIHIHAYRHTFQMKVLECTLMKYMFCVMYKLLCTTGWFLFI